MAYTTINKSTDYFNTNLYTGNNTQTSHTVGFQPDFTWLKVRNAVGNHYLYDAVRGANKDINANDDTAEYTATQNLMSFDANGYTVGTSNSINTNGETMVGWNWKANGAGSANTNGTISSTVSVNATSGFSIVKYTGNGAAGATIGHGLGSAPSAIFVKGLSAVSNWSSYHSVLGNTGYMRLDGTGAFTTASTYWNNTSPDNNVFTVGTTGNINASGNDFVAYCFAEKTGYSKFGKYAGNGNADGPFIYTGFRPAFVLTKYSSSTSGWWQILDNKRDVYNPNSHALFANVTDSEYNLSNYHTDYLSNGFKLRNSLAGGNTSGGTYIYMAFGQSLVGSNNIPCTAR